MAKKERKERYKTEEELTEFAEDAARSTIIWDAQGNVIKGEELIPLVSENLSLEEWKKQFEDPNDPDIEIIDLGEV